MKKEVLFFTAGVMTALGVTAFAAQMDVNPNSFPITLNGTPVEIEGYNLNGNTYFKLRDLGEKIGFGVDFQNDTIVITNNKNTPTDTATTLPGLPQQLPEGEGSTPSEAFAELKDRLAQKVASGEMTQAEADAIIAEFGEVSAPSAEPQT